MNSWQPTTTRTKTVWWPNFQIRF